VPEDCRIMKNLWRISILFMLPGVMLGGGTVLAFFRLADSGWEPLRTACLASVIWCLTFWMGNAVAAKIHNPGRFYYISTAVCALGMVLLTGICRHQNWIMVLDGWAGVVISAWALGWLQQSFISSSCTRLDRWSWISGVLISGVILIYGAYRSRLAWMETLFFYLAEFLLICWCFASPLSSRGSSQSKYFWRIILLAGAVGGFYLTPVFAPPPRVKAPATMPDGEWCKTAITVQGSRFIWMDKNSRYSCYTPAGRLLAHDENDEVLQGAIPGLLGIMPMAYPAVKIIAPVRSVLPGTWKKITGSAVRFFRLPESDPANKNLWKRRLFAGFAQYGAKDGKVYDLLLISALPENQYPSVICEFMKYAVSDLHRDGVIAVPANLLQNSALFGFLHENFNCCGVLPAPGYVWLFSNSKLDLSIDNIEKSLNIFYGADSPVPPGMYASVFGVNNGNMNNTQIPLPVEDLHLTGNKLYGKWWYLAATAVLVLLWRMIRLFGERRNIMYSYFNCIEQGYCAMGIFLFALGLAIIKIGLFSFFTALLALLFAASFSRSRLIGGWGLWCGLILMICAAWVPGGEYLRIWFLAAAMLLAMCSSAGAVKIFARTQQEERKLASAISLGYLLAALTMLAVWFWQLPLLMIWGLLAVSGTSGIWQYRRGSVYYKK